MQQDKKCQLVARLDRIDNEVRAEITLELDRPNINGSLAALMRTRADLQSAITNLLVA